MIAEAEAHIDDRLCKQCRRMTEAADLNPDDICLDCLIDTTSN